MSRRLAAAALTGVLFLVGSACSNDQTIHDETSTCEGAVRVFLEFTAQMQDDLHPDNTPEPELIDDQTKQAKELRAKSVEECGGEAGFLEEMARQRASEQDE